MREFAPAKINLYLHVTGQREDGYHLLDSIATFVDVGDVLDVQPASELTLTLTGRFADALAGEPAQDNLVFKAAHLLRQGWGVQQGAHMTLSKNLPIGSGIGGGSSDAAAALRVLTKLWELNITQTELLQTARKLGSDVAACLLAQTLRMQGAGDDVIPVSAEWPLCFLLVNPMKPVLTVEVYRQFKGHFSQTVCIDWAKLTQAECMAALQGLHNDLETAALALCPEIADVLAVLRGQYGCKLARMSGSGATCFGVFETEAKLLDVERNIAATHPMWWVQGARRIERDAAQ